MNSSVIKKKKVSKQIAKLKVGLKTNRAHEHMIEFSKVKKVMHHATNATLIIILLCAFAFLASTVKSDSLMMEESRLFYVTASASEGGSITPSGTNSYVYFSNASFTITPSPGNSIDEINIDGGKPFPATHFNFAQSYFNNTKTTVELELAVVNGQRYILEQPRLFSHFTIYEANSSWMPTSNIAISPVAVNFLFVPELSKNVNESSLFPNCIVVCGNQVDGKGFIALYNITANTWIWESIANTSYITDVLNPSSTDLVIHIADSNQRGFMRTTKDKLFDSRSWDLINLPASQTNYLQNGFLDTEIACFKDFVFTLDINAHYHNTDNTYSWCAYKYNLVNSTWESNDPVLSNFDASLPGAESLYGMVCADSDTLFIVAPFSNGTWSIYYSTDGSTFRVISSVESVNNFRCYPSHPDPNAEFAWASTFDHNSDYILFETVTDHDTNGYFAIVDLNGTIIYKQKGFTAHYAQGNQWLEEKTPEGKVFLTGSICHVSGYSAVIRKITIEYFSTKPFTFTFSNIAANHTIDASFNTPLPTPTATSHPIKNQFLIESNSTISALTFNATTSEISFTINGTSGTTGYVKATISKNLMPSGENIKIYMDEKPVNYTITSNGDWWVITFTYQHSTHQVKIYQMQDSGFTNFSAKYLPYILAAAFISLLTFLAIIIWSAKLKEPSGSPRAYAISLLY